MTYTYDRIYAKTSVWTLRLKAVQSICVVGGISLSSWYDLRTTKLTRFLWFFAEATDIIAMHFER